MGGANLSRYALMGQSGHLPMLISAGTIVVAAQLTLLASVLTQFGQFISSFVYI